MSDVVKNNTKEKIQSGSLDLNELGDLSSLLDEPVRALANTVASGPQELPLDVIDEDPNQPRSAANPGFLPESIAEIGETIQLRGVKSPISVRENPKKPGRYLINHGARRFRGAKWAKQSTIPAFIDNDYNESDQIIENLQRNELTAREIADFIGRELAKGKKKLEIAKEIGKSPAFVSQHVTLLDLPDPIAKVFNEGRSKDVTVINELVSAYKKNPEEVSVWLDDDEAELTRGSIKLMRGYLEEAQNTQVSKTEHEDHKIDATDTSNEMAIPKENKNVDELLNEQREQQIDRNFEEKETEKLQSKEINQERKKDDAPSVLKKVIIQVRYDDRLAQLILNRRPLAEGWAWIKYEDNGQELQTALTSMKLVALLEG